MSDEQNDNIGKNEPFDQKDFRTTMGQFCTGVVIATGAPGGVPAGFAAQSFVSLSLDPPLVAICPGKGSTSWPKIRDSGAFCVNMLHASQVDVCNHFAQSGGDKFSDLDWLAGITGAPILADALAYVECTLENEVDAGDHTIAIGRVKAYRRVDEEAGPLLFFRGKYGQFEAV